MGMSEIDIHRFVTFRIGRIFLLSVQHRFPNDFLGGGRPVVNKLDAHISQDPHALGLGLASQVIGVGILHDHVAQLVIEDHQLEQSDAALVAGVAATATAGAPIKFLALDFVTLQVPVPSTSRR